MSEHISEPDDYETTDDGITSPEDALGVDDQDDLLETGYSPPERARGLNAFGTTAAEERAGETLDQRLDQEEPEALDDDLDGDADDADEADADDDDEVGDLRAGRLVDPDQGGAGDDEKDLIGSDVGIDGAGASAEEAAVHIVP